MGHLLEVGKGRSEGCDHPGRFVGVQRPHESAHHRAHGHPAAVRDSVARNHLAVRAQVVEEGIEVALIEGP
eukprot:15068106-Alexandrium_andersonii.AAC.1